MAGRGGSVRYSRLRREVGVRRRTSRIAALIALVARTNGHRAAYAAASPLAASGSGLASPAPISASPKRRV